MPSTKFRFDLFKQRKFQEGTESWFGIFLSFIVAPLILSYLSYHLIKTELERPYTLITEIDSTTGVISKESYPELRCVSPSGCFFITDYTARGPTAKCLQAIGKENEDKLDGWKFVEYGETFNPYACYSPGALNGIFVVWARYPFHHLCSNVPADKRNQCIENFLSFGEEEGWSPCDITLNEAKRRNLNLDLKKKYREVIGGLKNSTLNRDFQQKQDKQTQPKAGSREESKGETRVGDRENGGGKEETTRTTTDKKNNPKKQDDRVVDSKKDKDKQTDYASMLLGPILTPEEKTALNNQMLSTNCFYDEHLWPLYYKYDQKSGRKPILQYGKKCRDSSQKSRIRGGNCDYTSSHYPYGFTIRLPQFTDMHELLKQSFKPDFKALMGNDKDFCEFIEESNKNQKVNDEMPLSYGTQMLSYKRVEFTGFSCQDSFKNPDPRNQTKVNYVQSFTPTPVSLYDGYAAEPMLDTTSNPIDTLEQWQESIPRVDELFACLEGKDFSCGNTKQLMPVADQIKTLVYLYSKDIRDNRQVQLNEVKKIVDSALDIDPENENVVELVKMYKLDHLAVSRLRLLPQYQVTTLNKKNVLSLTIGGIGGYLSLIFVLGRILTMIALNVYNMCCGRNKEENHTKSNEMIENPMKKV